MLQKINPLSQVNLMQKLILSAFFDFTLIPFFTGRITSYNVCYTKLLRYMKISLYTIPSSKSNYG